MRFPSKEQVARQRRLYPAGTRVELVQMDDAQAPPVGTRGTVIGVDDTGSIMVASPKLSSAANVVKCSAGSTGITEVSSPSSGAASVGWNPPD